MKNNIHKELYARKWSQADLAKIIGVKREYINKIATGKVTPRIPLALRIARALNMTVEEVFIEEDD